MRAGEDKMCNQSQSPLFSFEQTEILKYSDLNRVLITHPKEKIMEQRIKIFRVNFLLQSPLIFPLSVSRSIGNRKNYMRRKKIAKEFRSNLSTYLKKS